MAQAHEVLVIGAGVSGLTSALCLADRGVDVHIVAADAPPGTTSAVAGALINGQVTGEPDDPATEWARVSGVEFTHLADDPSSGVAMARGRMVSTVGNGTPPWATALPGFRPCRPAEAAGFPVAFWMDSPVVDMPRYLDYLVARLHAAGVKIDIAALGSFAEAAAYAPLIVNCAGLGSMQLAGDPRMTPVRGQHVVVDNPGIDEFFYERSPQPSVTSYIPHGGRLVLGGSIERGDANTSADPQQAEQIVARCAAIEPRIADAPVLRIDVGLRPGRGGVRLEAETVNGTPVVHNYGHAGIGVALSWGCARAVEELVTAGSR